MTLAGGAGDQVAGVAGEGGKDGGGGGRGGRQGEKVGLSNIIHLQTPIIPEIEAQYEYFANHIEPKEKECALHLQLLADFSSGHSGAHATRELSS